MKLWVFSDTHGGFDRPQVPDADVAVVSGDLGKELVDAVEWLAATIKPFMRVVFVAGNHEYYRRSIEPTLVSARKVAVTTGVDLLENNTVEIGGVRFAGATLWTDYALFGEESRRIAMDAAARGLNDHRLISVGPVENRRRFLPTDAAARHAESVRFLSGLSHAPDATPLVVVTHHAPSARSLDAAFDGNPLNPAFGSNLDALVETTGADLWVHGHTHANADIRIGRTRVLCNPHGYGNENPGFDPALVVSIRDGGTR